MYKNSRFIICGGGTGGHLFPAMEIESKLSNYGANVLYMGSKYGIESTRIRKDKNTFLLDIKGIHRTLSFSNIIDNIKFPFRMFFSIIKSLRIMYIFNPKVVIGTGGYSSGIPLISALILGKKILIQEQNSYPGITTRILSNFADKICLGYNDCKQYLNKNSIFTGNPIRSDILITNKNDAKKKLKIPNKLFTIFISGGSQGSKPINDHIINNLDYFNNLNAKIIWQCGVNHYKKISLLDLNTNIILYDFINDIGKIYSASDLVISRSGALTLSEINLFGKASILIPFPFSAGNHQYKNALYSKKSNAAIIVNQDELTNGELEKKINNLIKSAKNIKSMEVAAKSISTPNATDKILNEIQSLIC